MKAAAPKNDPARSYSPGSLRDKLRKRGIIGALAAFAGSGWLVYEIVHFILVDHYHLPEGLKDITIVEKEKDVYWRLPSLALAYHAAGRADDSDAALSEFIAKYQDVGAFQVAQVYAFRGETGTAFEWLEKAYAQRDGGLFLTKADPFLRRLKGDVRFGAFLKKMRLPQD